MNKKLVTNYELELLKLLSQGYNRKEIAEIKGMTYYKCCQEYKQICKKLGLSNIISCILLVLFNIDTRCSRVR